MNFSLTGILNNLATKFTFLNLKTDDDVASFSAHVGWSTALTFGSLHLFGHFGLYVTSAAWFLNWTLWKMVDRGHLALIFSDKEFGTDLQNLVVNFFSNMTVPLAAVLLVWFR